MDYWKDVPGMGKTELDEADKARYSSAQINKAAMAAGIKAPKIADLIAALKGKGGNADRDK